MQTELKIENGAQTEAQTSADAGDGVRQSALDIAPIGKRSPPRHDEILIAQTGDWVLTLVGEWSNERWVSCKLYYVGEEKRRRTLFYVGVSGGRHSRNRDVAYLQKNHAEILEWIVAQAMATRRTA